MKSGCPNMTDRRRQPRIPNSRKTPIKRSSVDLFPVLRTLDMISDRCLFENVSAIAAFAPLPFDPFHFECLANFERVAPNEFRRKRIANHQGNRFLTRRNREVIVARKSLK